jgi:DNA topoisomerase-3
LKAIPDELTCPKCQKGTILKGNSFGCSNYKSGCDFKVPFDVVREIKRSKPTKELVYKILNESV